MRTCDKLATGLATFSGGDRDMKTQWEYDLVENPFCEQIKGMGWEWLRATQMCRS